MNIFKKVPIPICAVILGMFGLGNLLQSYSEGVRLLCGAVGAVADGDVSHRRGPGSEKIPGRDGKSHHGQCVLCLSHGRHDAGHLCETLHRRFRQGNLVCGCGYSCGDDPLFHREVCAAFFHRKGFCQLVYRLCRHCHGRNHCTGLWNRVHRIGLCLVRHCGFGSAADSGDHAVCEKAGSRSAKPVVCIYAAPTSLCIAGYIQSVTPKSLSLLTVLWAVATVLFLLACVKFVQYFKLPFFPSYAAYTFPFVISAIASKQLMACAANMGSPMGFLSTVVLVETIIATCTTLYALIGIWCSCLQHPNSR